MKGFVPCLQVVENAPNLFIREAMVTDVILGKNDEVLGVHRPAPPPHARAA